MGIPTRSETYMQILENLIKVQEGCSMMAHLHQTEDNQMDKLLAKGWLGMAELFRKVQFKVTELAQGRLN